MPRINMRQMKEKQSGIITAIKANGELGRRIRDMGLVPGTQITIHGRAPLYDPVALRRANRCCERIASARSSFYSARVWPKAMWRNAGAAAGDTIGRSVSKVRETNSSRVRSEWVGVAACRKRHDGDPILAARISSSTWADTS